jgi:hypothetical protein
MVKRWNASRRQLYAGGTLQPGTDVPVYRETLPNGVSYTTLDLTPNSPGDNTREFVVPEGHYFMMGDNRDNSQDSRFEVGYVPLENFIGRATIIFFSIGEGASPLESGNGRPTCVWTGSSNPPSDDNARQESSGYVARVEERIGHHFNIWTGSSGR